jgi:hypothetical protein
MKEKRGIHRKRERREGGMKERDTRKRQECADKV